MNRDIEMLNRGILPDSLNFNINQTNEIDMYKLAYNLRYKSIDYWESKFPAGFECIPGFDKIIEKIVDEALTPLEELNLIQENTKQEEVTTPQVEATTE
jgi:hypothetical protein